ncbi:transposase [Fusibacter tunisiensis]|uniref:REP element-mobilizing transposase RayT n=1 Tax=Fusibacter tunisiensis TaxID=1008308 RepID=A0ABS2MT32_9FIRM|nr:transposase [Fusibacter tunisiensis]MBM7562548.1 REP element-mobilizing transposase RayT [Fusibacter tunisiensis]
MARKAREADEFGVYHIEQSSVQGRLLFNDDGDRAYFLEILNQAKRKFGFRLFAYCLRNSNTYHLIIHVNGGDLSKIMKSIHIAYAMRFKGQGKLYKDRYRSTLIEDEQMYLETKRMIEADWVEGNCFNSDSNYCDTSGPFDVACEDCIRTVDEARAKLTEIALKEKVDVQKLMKEKNRRNQLIVELRKTSLLSLKEIGDIFGGLSESTICKILKKEL